MIGWLRKLWRGKSEVGLDERVASAKKERDEVREMRPETERLQRRLQEHERENHFAARFERAFSERRGRHA